MRTAIRALLGALLLGTAFAAPGAARAETLAAALAAGYESSGLLEQNRAVLRAADEDVAQAVAALRPVVSWVSTFQASAPASPFAVNTFGGFQGSTSLGLQATVTLFDAGQRELAIDQQKEAVLATRQALLDVEQQVLFRVVQAYLEVQRVGAFVDLRQNNVRVITQELRAARDRFEVGEVTRTDVALAEAQLASANSALAAAQGNYNIARERYKAAIGHYPGNLSGLPRLPTTAKTIAGARAIALRTHPVILQAQHQARASDFGVELARAEMMPTVDGSASLRQTFRGDNNPPFFSGGLSDPIEERFGINMTQTIYAGGRLSSALRKAIAQQQSSHAGLLQTGVNVDEAVGRAWSNILVANVSIEAGSEQIRAAQAAYDGVKQEADLGSRTLLDVLDADQNLLSAKAARLQASANFYVSQYQLLSAMGLLTAQHLRLGIPTFDPSAYLNAVKNAPATSGRGAKLDRILKTLGK